MERENTGIMEERKNQPYRGILNRPSILKILSRMVFSTGMDDVSRNLIEYEAKDWSSPGIVVAAPHVVSNEILAAAQIVPHEAFPVYPWVAYSFFKNSLPRFMLGLFGAIPVPRSKDIKNRRKRKEMLEKLYKTSLQLLKEGKRIAVLPEGTRNKNVEIYSHPDGVGVFQKGAFLVAESYLAKEGNVLYFHIFSMKPGPGRGISRLPYYATTLLHRISPKLAKNIWRYVGLGTHEEIRYARLKAESVVDENGGLKTVLYRLVPGNNTIKWEYVGEYNSSDLHASLMEQVKSVMDSLYNQFTRPVSGTISYL